MHNCAGAIALSHPRCTGSAALGEPCAGVDAAGGHFAHACLSSVANEPLVCGREAGEDTSKCMLAATAAVTDALTSECDDEALTPPAAELAASPAPPPLQHELGVCCGEGNGVATGGSESECCPWGVDAAGDCCSHVDACGMCNGAAVAVDADGARPPHAQASL
jgi:hypothetical protein